jgi:hypothetical protein
MSEEPAIIRMNISRYEAMRKTDMDQKKRAVLKQLLAEAQEALGLATD